MKPETAFQKARSGSKLVPTYEAARNQKIGLKKVFSQRKFPGTNS